MLSSSPETLYYMTSFTRLDYEVSQLSFQSLFLLASADGRTTLK